MKKQLDIVKKAVDLYLQKNIDPNITIAAWVKLCQPSEALIKYAIQEVNKRIYLTLLKETPTPRFILADLNKVAKYLDKNVERRAKRLEAFRKLPHEKIREAEFDRYLRKMGAEAKEKLKKYEPRENVDEIKSTLRRFVKEAYKTLQAIITDLKTKQQNLHDETIKSLCQLTFTKNVSPEKIGDFLYSIPDINAVEIFKDYLKQFLSLKGTTDPYIMKNLAGNIPVEFGNTIRKKIRTSKNLLRIVSTLEQIPFDKVAVLNLIDQAKTWEDLKSSPVATQFIPKFLNVMEKLSNYYDFSHLNKYKDVLEIFSNHNENRNFVSVGGMK
ncbi:MAG: hypothetical protein QW228_01405 [Candidatus Aenigmatarchaeota archaeon]